MRMSLTLNGSSKKKFFECNDSLLSFHHTQYCVTDKSQHKDFNISQALVQEYPETGLQPLYFVAQSLADMKRKMM